MNTLRVLLLYVRHLVHHFDSFHLFEADIMNLVRQSYIHVDVQDACADVRVDMQNVRIDVQDVCVNVRDIGNMVQGVDDKLDKGNRSLSLDPDSHSTRSHTCVYANSGRAEQSDKRLRSMQSTRPATYRNVRAFFSPIPYTCHLTRT